MLANDRVYNKLYSTDYNNMVLEMDHTTIRNPSWWMRRTNCERRLIILTLILTFTTIALLTALTTVLQRRSNLKRMGTSVFLSHQQQLNPICLTSGCNKTTSMLLKSMDLSASPCYDFYQFACGGFLRKAQIPDDNSLIDFFTIAEDEVKEKIRAVLDQQPTSQEPDAFRILRNVYDTCMNVSFIENQGLTEIKKILREVGGWPVLENSAWSESKFDWKETSYRLRKMGYNPDYLFGLQVFADAKNTSKRIIGFDSGSVAIPDDRLYTKVGEVYLDYVVEVAVILGANRRFAVKDLKKSIEFEAELYYMFPTTKEQRDPSALYNPMTIEQLQQKFPTVPWLEYIGNVLDIPNIRLDKQQIVDISYERQLRDVLNYVQETPKRVIANYFLWRVVESSIPYLTERLKHEKFLLEKSVHGYKRAIPKWKECVDDVSKKMDVAVSALYARTYPNKEAIKKINKMVFHIMDAFKELVKRTRWLDEETRKNVLIKANAITKHIAYPSELFDDNKLNEFYSKLRISSPDYLRTVLDLSLFATNRKFEQLRLPVNKSDWFTHLLSTDVDTYYVDEENSIKVSFGIIHDTIFDLDRPSYMNYGALGYFIGHEIIHGFDSNGRKYDHNGNLNNWWTKEMNPIYENKTECFIDQYNNFTLPKIDIKVDGYNTHEENIADNGGLRLAYLAYKEFSEDNCPELQLPNLDYTPKQMFWISAANMWCTKLRTEQIKWEIENNEHSLNFFRVLGPFRNSEEFAQDFQCPLGSPMNPEKKCRIW